MVVTGEVSGDHHAAQLVKVLQELAPGPIEIFGMGGSHLRLAGMETVIDSESEASVMGLLEVVSSLPRILKAFRKLVNEARKRKPAVAILLDFPDFNLRLAKKLKRLGIPVVYFITPQVWAWRRSRVRQIKKYVTKAAPIFPFEEGFLRQHGVNATYVGHPFLDRPPLEISREQFLLQNGLDTVRPVVALLPGSRHGEVSRLIEPMLLAFARLQNGRPGIQGIVPVAPTLSMDEFEQYAKQFPAVSFIRGHSREALMSADAAVVASGTATVEAALEGVPFVVVYKLAPVTYKIAKLIVRGVSNFGMVNLIAGKKIIPELLQSAVTPERIANELEKILGDEANAKRMRKSLELVHERLSNTPLDGNSSAERVGQLVAELLQWPGAGLSASTAPGSRVRRVATEVSEKIVANI